MVNLFMKIPKKKLIYHNQQNWTIKTNYLQKKKIQNNLRTSLNLKKQSQKPIMKHKHKLKHLKMKHKFSKKTYS